MWGVSHMSLPGVPFWRHLQLRNLTTSSEQMLPEDMKGILNVGKTVDQSLETRSSAVKVRKYGPYLAIGDCIKQLIDLCWCLDVFFFRGQRVRGGQGINSKHSVHVIQHNEVFLLWDKSDTAHLSPQIIVKTSCHYTSLWGIKLRDKIYHFPLRFSFVCSQVLNIGCKAFI